MSGYKNSQQGFTAVELVVALVVGVLLLGSAYQLYATIVNDAGDTGRRAQASNAAYTLLRQYQDNTAFAGDPCVSNSATPTLPTSANLPGATATVVTTCPTPNTDLNLITVTVEYNNANTKEKVTRAILVKAT